MTKTFQDQVAVVTGAGEGIGYEIARQLAEQGADVLLNDLDTEKAKHAAATISEAGGHCEGVGGDVADVDTVRGLVDQAVSLFGRLDLAVANAGLTHWSSFLDYTPENFHRVLDVNLGGSFFLAQAGARQMRRQGTGGRILLMSSVVGHQAIPSASVYATTKAGLEMLARTLVLELSPLGITVNAVAPGATATPRTLADDPNHDAAWEKLTPMGRPAYPADIAQAALFFLSPAAGHITGQTLIVDGGWTAVSPMPPSEPSELNTSETL